MPLLDLFWVMLMWFLFFAWLIVIIAVVTDIFRSHDLSGAAKSGWVLFVILIPWLGVIVYLITRGESMTVRYLEALGKRDRRRIVDPQGGTSMGIDWRRSADARYVGMSGAIDFDTQSARVLR